MTMPADVMMIKADRIEVSVSTPTMDKMALLQEVTELDQVVDIVTSMRKQEQTTYHRSDYLAFQQLGHILDGSWRQRIVEWMYGVVDHCSLRRDSVATATFYLDLCVERGLVVSREEYQLAAMTALQVAIKLCDSTVVKLQSMVALGRGLFTAEDVVLMERRMLEALRWNCHPPTPVCFLRQFLRLLPPDISPFTRYMIAEVTRFISEISVCLYRFVKFPPSVVAYAGMLIAMERFDDLTLPLRQRHAIFAALSGVGLDVGSEEVLGAVAALQQSLENNASMHELLSTINSQCAASSPSSSSDRDGGCPRKASPCGPGTSFAPAGSGGPFVNSPRDVTGRP